MQQGLVSVQSLSSNQQVALWVILRLNQNSFYSSDVAKSKFFTKKGKKAVGGILGSLYRNHFIDKVAGGRDKLWKLSDETEKNKQQYKDGLFRVKTYWK